MLSIDKQALEHALAKTMNWNFDLAKEKLLESKETPTLAIVTNIIYIKLYKLLCI